MADHERTLISQRTRDGLAAAKAHGVLGNRQLHKVRNTDNSAAVAKRVESAKIRNQHIAEVIDALKEDHEGITPTQIADELNKAEYTTARGKAFTRTQVYRALASRAVAWTSKPPHYESDARAMCSDKQIPVPPLNDHGRVISPVIGFSM